MTVTMYVFSRKSVDKIKAVVGWHEREVLNSASPTVAAGAHGQQQAHALVEVVALRNDYLEAKRIDVEGASWGVSFFVAKPPKLRHDVAQHPGLSSLDSDSPNQVSVSGGGVDEVWVVTPTLAVGDHVYISPVGYSGVSVDYGGSIGTRDLKWMLVGEWAFANVSDTSGGGGGGGGA